MKDDLNGLPQMLTLAEVARFLRSSRSHLSNLVNGKLLGMPTLPTVRLGRRILVRRESLIEWIVECEAAELVGLK